MCQAHVQFALSYLPVIRDHTPARPNHRLHPRSHSQVLLHIGGGAQPTCQTSGQHPIGQTSSSQPEEGQATGQPSSGGALVYATSWWSADTVDTYLRCVVCGRLEGVRAVRCCAVLCGAVLYATSW